MILTYWICEHKEKGPAFTLRFLTREIFDKYIEKEDIRVYVQQAYDLPREVTVKGDNILGVINACLGKGDHQPLPWE